MAVDRISRIDQLAIVSDFLRSQANLSWEAFRWLHAGCSVKVLDLPTTNSSETDPATGDLKPIFSQQLYCVNHGKRSAVHGSVGQ